MSQTGGIFVLTLSPEHDLDDSESTSTNPVFPDLTIYGARQLATSSELTCLQITKNHLSFACPSLQSTVGSIDVIPNY